MRSSGRRHRLCHYLRWPPWQLMYTTAACKFGALRTEIPLKRPIAAPHFAFPTHPLCVPTCIRHCADCGTYVAALERCAAAATPQAALLYLLHYEFHSTASLEYFEKSSITAPLVSGYLLACIVLCGAVLIAAHMWRRWKAAPPLRRLRRLSESMHSMLRPIPSVP